MDAKELHIPDTNDPNELRLFILKLRDMLIDMQAENLEKEKKYKLELEGCRVLADAATERLDIIYKNLDDKRLYDYKAKKYFDIFS